MKQIQTKLWIVALAIGALGLSGCAHRASQAQIGTGVGAVAGGVLGNAVLGTTFGTIGGAAAGALVGNHIGQNMHGHDRKRPHKHKRGPHRHR